MEPVPHSRPSCEHACDCRAHRPAPRARGTGPWSALLLVLACSTCPVCLATYAKLLSMLGVGVGVSLSETQHLVILASAVAASVVVSAWRSWRTKRVWPIATAAVGATLVLAGHLLGDLELLEWAGIFTLLVGGLTEQFRLRRLTPAVPLRAGSAVLPR